MTTREKTCAKRGFTLVELLVGLAIFTTIMAGVTIMFNSAVRTTKLGYQNQRAFENVRGAFTIIEEDLTRSFGSRKTGHKHTFYGTPFGFSFIGLVPTEDEAFFNTARISYVVYGQADTARELTREYVSVADDNVSEEQRERVTYSLIRFVEPATDDLDSYPVNWLSGTTGSEGNSLATYLVAAGLDANRNNDQLCFDVAGTNLADSAQVRLQQMYQFDCLRHVIEAKKRELWLRMLAGDPRLPDFWGDTSGTLRIGDLTGDPLNPADYIVAENLLHIERYPNPAPANPTPGGEPFEPFDPENPDYRFGYDVVTTDPFSGFPPFIDGQGEDAALVELVDPIADPNTQWAVFRNFVVAQNLAVSPYTPRNYFFAYREYDSETVRNDPVVTENGVLLDGSVSLPNTPSLLFENEQAPRLFAFWNDSRNRAWNRYVNEVIYADNFTNSVLATAENVSTVPDIIDPALPESILIEFAVFYPTAYPGAPDFQKVFSHRINLPTAHRRKSESLFTKQVRDAQGR